MPHSLAANLVTSDFNSATLTYFSLKPNPLVFTAVTFPVLLRSENTLTKQTVFFGLLGAVIYSFGAFNHAVAPIANLLGGSQSDFH
jgi:hypothetical protein